MEVSISSQIKVGIFIALGFVVVLGSIFFLGADKTLFTSYVKLNAHFEQVQGLAAGSVVSLSGVNVGNVEKIEFISETNSLNVVLLVNDKFMNRITTGSTVEIRTQGALGDKYVFIYPGPYNEAPLQEGAILPVAKATDLIGVVSERGNEFGKVFDMINDMEKLTAQVTKDNKIPSLVHNLELASRLLVSASQRADTLLQSVNTRETGEKLHQAAERLENIMRKIDAGQGSLGALINDPTLHTQLKSLLGGQQKKENVKSILRTSIKEAK